MQLPPQGSVEISHYGDVKLYKKYRYIGREEAVKCMTFQLIVYEQLLQIISVSRDINLYQLSGIF